jgi:hypothetical protein
MSNTFKNLEYLKSVQDQVKHDLGKDYEKTIQPFVKIIEMVMKANDINEFDAMLKIKSELEAYRRENGPPFFSAALVEIVESKHFQGFEK